MRPFVLTLLILAADQNCAVPGHIYNSLQFSTIFVYGFQTEREPMKLLLIFTVIKVISFSKSQYCEGQHQGIFPLVNYSVDNSPWFELSCKQTVFGMIYPVDKKLFMLSKNYRW